MAKSVASGSRGYPVAVSGRQRGTPQKKRGALNSPLGLSGGYEPLLGGAVLGGPCLPGLA